MSYDQTYAVKQQSRFARWKENWISDWFGLFDIAVGIITLTSYYPNTQGWWFKRCGRVGDDPGTPNARSQALREKGIDHAETR